MSYFKRFVKIQILWRDLNQYIAAKTNAVESLADQSNHVVRNPAESSGRLHRLWVAMQTETTPEGYAWTGCKGFTGGVLLSCVTFIIGVLAFRLSLHKATWISSGLAIFLCFGLAFSSVVRCYTLMILPQLFSKRGRQAITAYAFVLALGGPARNSVHNLGIMADSLGCAQDQLKRMLREVSEMVMAPMRALKEALKNVVTEIKEAVQPVKDAVLRFARLIKAVLSVLSGVFSWLGGIVNMCNTEIGSPYMRCVKSFDEAIADCRAKLGIMKFLCEIVTGVKALCHIAKIADVLCMAADAISDAVIGKAKRRLAIFRQQMKQMFFVSIEMEHSMDMETTASQSFASIMDKVEDEVEERTKIFRKFFSIAFSVPFLAFLFLIFKMVYYKHKFLTCDRFDNIYVNRRLLEIDFVRLRNGQETVLPLELRETNFYIKATSLRLVAAEKFKVIRGVLFLMVTTTQIACYMIYDQAIYWTLVLIRKQALMSSGYSGKGPALNVQVDGGGALADLYQKMGNAFQPPPPSLDLDPVPCLPNPSPPEVVIYVQIGMMLLISWILVLTEPYGLRLRHIIMGYYYPSRAQQRTVWLHNHILRARGLFSHFARRKNMDQALGVEKVVGLWESLVARNQLLMRIFSKDEKLCTVCAMSEGKAGLFATCPTPGCSAIYCPACLHTLKACPLCSLPISTDDLTDFNPERDSSGDELKFEKLSTSDDIERGVAKGLQKRFSTQDKMRATESSKSQHSRTSATESGGIFSSARTSQYVKREVDAKKRGSLPSKQADTESKNSTLESQYSKKQLSQHGRTSATESGGILSSERTSQYVTREVDAKKGGSLPSNAESKKSTKESQYSRKQLSQHGRTSARESGGLLSSARTSQNITRQLDAKKRGSLPSKQTDTESKKSTLESQYSRKQLSQHGRTSATESGGISSSERTSQHVTREVDAKKRGSLPSNAESKKSTQESQYSKKQLSQHGRTSATEPGGISSSERTSQHVTREVDAKKRGSLPSNAESKKSNQESQYSKKQLSQHGRTSATESGGFLSARTSQKRGSLPSKQTDAESKKSTQESQY